MTFPNYILTLLIASSFLLFVKCSSRFEPHAIKRQLGGFKAPELGQTRLNEQLRDIKFNLDTSNFEHLTKTCLKFTTDNEDPGFLNVTFHLYTRKNPHNPYIMNPRITRNEILHQSPFNSARPIRWVIHGFRTNLELSDWMIEAKDKILFHEDANVILTNWGRGASPWFSLGYPKAAANMYIVAQMIVNILRRLGTDNIEMNRVHLIGHSLGAHIMGFVGSAFAAEYLEQQKQLLLLNGPDAPDVMRKRLGAIQRKLIGRIMACDPALPCFGPRSEAPEWRSPKPGAISSRVDTDEADWNHLKPDSALTVEVMHSNPRILGYSEPLGDFDFYPNGFVIPQPGCRNSTLKKLQKNDSSKQKRTVESIADAVEAVTCSHHRSVDYMVESLYSDQSRGLCQMIGYRCASYENFERGFCYECPRIGFDCRIFGSSGQSGSSLDIIQKQTDVGIRQPKARLDKQDTMHHSIEQRVLPDLKESYINKLDISKTKSFYYFNTKEEKNFCLHHYHLRINYRHYSLGSKETNIDEIVLVGSLGHLNRTSVTLNRFTHHSYTTLLYDRSRSKHLGSIELLTMYTNDDEFKTISIDNIEVTYLSHLDPNIRSQSSAKLCRPVDSMDSHGLAIKDKSVTVFTRCDESVRMV